MAILHFIPFPFPLSTLTAFDRQLDILLLPCLLSLLYRSSVSGPCCCVVVLLKPWPHIQESGNN